MATKQELSQLEDLASVTSSDKILGYNPTANKFGFVPLDFVTNNGYACRRWNEASSTPVGEACGNIEYLRNLPSLLGLGCYLVDKNHGRRKLDPANHYKFATGETAKLDGSMGDYMWGWGTSFYYATWTEGQYYYEAASLKPIPGRLNYRIPVASMSALGVAVVDRENDELVSVINEAGRYRGGNNDATLDTAFNTQLGRAATNETCEAYSIKARKKGDYWEANWYGHRAITAALMRIIMGTRNLQSAYNANKDANGLYQGGLGSGVTNVGTWWSNSWDYYPFLPTSVGVELGDKCGVSSYTVKNSAGTALQTVSVPVFFGLKNFFGYIGRWGRGRLIEKIAGGGFNMWVTTKLSQTYSMTSTAGLVKAATGPANSSAGWSFIKKMSMNYLCHTPTVVGGTESTYYADACYNDNAASGLRVPYEGGHADYSGTAGPEYLAVSNAVTTAVAHVGVPLCEAEEDWSTEPFLVPA